jgi:GNAT superfamily N-acetyltransferase
MLGQTTLQLAFRDFEPSDYGRFVEISNANFPDYPTSVSQSRHLDETIDRSKYYRKRYVCTDQESGRALGFSVITHNLVNFHPQKFQVEVIVDREYQGRGVGSRMYDKMLDELRTLNATVAWTFIKEDMDRPFAFAEKRGFVEKKRAWESRLNLSEFDPGQFQTYANKISRSGIKISTLPEEEKARDSEALREAYELAQDCWADVPLPVPYTKVSFEQWETRDLNNPDLIRDAYFIASDGQRYAGYSCLWRSENEPTALYQAMTGVRRKFRGRGLAIALKLSVIDYARRHGYEVIKTWNDSSNAPMLGINVRLGFKRQVGWITMEKSLQ